MTNQLDDQWGSLYYPVLRRIAEVLEVEHEDEARPEDVAVDIGIDQDDAIRAAMGLYKAGYLEGLDMDPYFIAQAVTERGRRAVGIWPGDSEVNALVRALENAADVAETDEDRGRLRRAATEIAKVGRDLTVEVIGAVLARSAGL